MTTILRAINDGDARAASELLPIVYDELRRLAAQRMAQEAPGQTLQATALVHEAYARLVGDGERGNGQAWDGQGHFFAAAAEAMRRILIEKARARGAVKRGGGLKRSVLDPDALCVDSVPEELIDLNEALTKFAEEEPRKAELVKLRFFGGLTLPEAASMLQVSLSTAERDWAYAKAWLYAEMTK